MSALVAEHLMEADVLRRHVSEGGTTHPGRAIGPVVGSACGADSDYE